MDALQKNIASSHGESLAAHVLASAAIQLSLLSVANKKTVLDDMTAFLDQQLNSSGPSSGDAKDELNAHVRDVDRFQAMQTLDAIARNLPPSQVT